MLGIRELLSSGLILFARLWRYLLDSEHAEAVRASCPDSFHRDGVQRNLEVQLGTGKLVRVPRVNTL